MRKNNQLLDWWRFYERKVTLSKKIAEVVTKSTRKKFAQSWVFNILKKESTIPPNEEIIRHNICNVELQPSMADVWLIF